MRYPCLAALLVFSLAFPVLAATDISLPAGVTVAPNQQVAFPVTLAQPAPSGGVFVTLTSSDTNIATIRPTSVYIPDGQTTTVSYSVQLIAGNNAGVVTVTAMAANLTGDTETVYVGTAPPPAAIMLPSGVTVAPGQPRAFPVTLSAPAPAGGVTVTLASSDTTKAMVSPGAVAIAAGSTTPAAQPQVTGVAVGSALIGATAPGYTSASQTVLVQAAPPAALSFAPPALTIPGVGMGNLQLNLSVPAPAGGLTVNLSSSNSAAVTVPATVSFAANATSANVAVNGVAPGSATVSAGAPSVSGASAGVTVTSGRDIILPSGLTLAVGEQRRIPISLSKSAPSDGVFITLSSSDTSKVGINPTTVFIPEGSMTASVQPTLTGGMDSGSSVITAVASGLTGDSEVVLVGNASTLSPSNLVITGTGGTQNLSLTLSSPAPAGGVTFNLSSSNPGVATVPATVLVAPFSSSASVPVTGASPGSAVIHASSLPAFGDTTATVTVMGSGTIGLPSGLSVPLGQSAPFAVTIGPAAPAGGVTVTLNSSDTSKVAISPAMVTIPGGANMPATQPSVTGVGIGSATINAAASGYTSAAQTVQVVETLSFAPASLTITGAAVQNLTLSLSAPLAAGLTVTLVSSNPGVATVPASAAFAAGATSVSVPVTGIAPGATTITASAANITSAAATVTVSGGAPMGAIGLPANVTIGPGQPAPFPVTLSIPAPAGGLTVSLTSGSSAVTVTPSVTIAGGAITPVTPPQITGVSFGSAVIGASAPGYASASQTVQVGANLSFTPSTLNTGAGPASLQLNLSAPAPAAGLTVNLSSSNTAAATVPATVTFPANATTVAVPVTGAASGTATITASVGVPNVPSTTATVVVSARGIILPSGITLMLLEQRRIQVTLAQPAPSGGVYVTLSSSDTTKLTVSPTTLIIPETATTSSVQPLLTGLDFGSATLTASALGSGLTGDSQTVLIGATLGFSPPSLTISGPGTTQNLLLNLPVPAPAGGLTVTLSSSNPAAATVPATLTFPAGASSLSVPVTSSGPGSTVIHASALPNLPDTTATVTVLALSSIGLPSNFNVPLGAPVAFPITLGAAAPAGGVVVTLTSGDTLKVTVSPGTVLIPEGATTPSVQPQLTSVNIGTVAITASANGYATAVVNVQATATVTFSPTSIVFTSLGTQRVLLALSASAPPGTTQAGRCESPDPNQCSITVNLSSDNPAVATVQQSVSYFPDGSSQAINQIPITAVGQGTTIIHAGAPPYIPDTTLMVTVGGPLQPPVANAGGSQTVAIGATVQLNGTGTDPQGLPLTYQWSLTKPAGSAAALSNAGAQNPTFVADKFGTYTAQLIVTNGTLSSAPATVAITTQRPKPIANAGAAQSVIAGSTVNLSGSGSSVDNSPLTYAFTLSPPSGSGATLSGANTKTPSFVADIVGTYTVQLIVNDGFLNSDPSTVTITATPPAGGPASITASSGTPQTTNLNQAPCAPLTALGKDSLGNPLSGVTITFTAPSSGPSGTFAGSVTTATAVTDGSGTATAPVFTGNGTTGSYTVTASVAGVSTPASFALTNAAGAPPSISATSGTSQAATVGASFAAPLVATVTGSQCGNSVMVTFAAPGSGAGGTFAGGGTTATVTANGSGVATSPVFTANAIPGGYSVTASAPGSNQASFALTNLPAAGSGGITISGVFVGQNLQAAVTLTLAQPAGPSGVQVNVSSGDPSKLLVAGRSGDVGQGSLPQAAVVEANSSTTTIFVQALGSSGTVTVSASGSDGSSGTGAISLTPSGFVLFGPSGAGVSSFSTGIGVNTPLTITAARLDSSFNFVEPQPLRTGSSATVAVNTSDAGVGTVSPAAGVTLTSQNSSVNAQFTAVGVGSATITAVVPPGFSTPAANTNMLTANVTPSGLTAGNTSVGNNLETTTNVVLNGAAPSGGLAVTVTSSDSSKLLLSTASDTAGSGFLVLNVPAGLSHTQDFYVQGLAGGGTVTYTATAPGFGTNTGTVALTPSGIVVAGPFGVGVSFPTAIGATPSSITLYSVQVNNGTFPVQQVRGGATVSIGVTSSNTAVGTIASSPLTIAGGSSSALTSFQPLAAGSTTIAASMPPGFSYAGSVTATVAKPGISVTDQATIGMNLEIAGTFVLGEGAPAGGLTVTLISGASNLLLSNSATTAGSGTIPIVLKAGDTSGTFYLQGLASSGSAPYTVSAPGYQSRTGTINFGPSGLTLGSTYGAGFFVPTPATVGTPLPLTVSTVLLDGAGNPVGGPQQLAAGYTLSASLTSSDTAVGTVPPQITITGGQSAAMAQFTPKKTGIAILSVSNPPGYTPPAGKYSSLTVNVQ